MDQRHRSRNTMFWRRDEIVAEASKHPGWAPFHRTCGRAGLFFDDIDPVGDNGKDVTQRPRRGYQALTFRTEIDRRGLKIAWHVARGTGPDPIAAVVSAYHASRAVGFPVAAGLETIFSVAELIG